MSTFRNMDQPESNDISKHPDYASLDDAGRSKVNERYSSVYLARQRFGEKIAQGMAFEAAKQMCEQVIAEKHLGFAKLKGELADRPGVTNPGALAAYIGDKKYGKKAMHSAAKNHEALGEGEINEIDLFQPHTSAHPVVKKHLGGIDPSDLTHAEKQMMAGGHPKKVLSGIAYNDMTHAEKQIAKHFKMSEDEAMGTADPAPGDVNEDDLVKQAVSHTAKFGSAFGVPKQAEVPKAHSITFDAKASTPAVPHAELPHGGETDPEDGNSKGMQKKNLMDKCVNCGMFPCCCPSSMKEGKNHTFNDIEHGDSVKYKTPQGQIGSGTAHIMGDGGSHWVLKDSSKSGGTGKIVDPKNFHSVTKRGKKLSSANHFLVYGSGGKPKNEEVEIDPLVMAAVGYLDHRAEVSGIMESIDSEAGELIEKFEDIGHGDHVTIKTPQNQHQKGKVVMKSSHGGWVLNMGGRHGTPGLVDAKNYVSHRKAAKKKSDDSFARDMVRHEKGLTDR